ncbi:MAG: ferritin-like domain-containing protein [Haloferacaceae archaeon]
MSVGSQIRSDHQLARLLQIGVVLEEVVEARAVTHYRELLADRQGSEELAELLEGAAEESATHREKLEALIDQLDAESIPFEEIELLVEERYGRTKPEDFDDVLYDQLASEETAYKFYDDLLTAIDESDARYSIDRDELIETLAWIREEEAEGVEEVTELMEKRA